MSESSPRFSAKLITITLVVSFFISYLAENIKKRHQLSSDASRLNTVISEAINHVNSIGTYLGRKIADNDKYEDWQYIYNLFKETASLQISSDNISSWAIFSWGDSEHRLKVNTVSGISKNPESLIDRNYTWRAKYEPWTMQFSKPVYGIVSKTWILPSAIGVSNIRDEFKGSVITGINIKALLNKSESSLRSNNAFILANRDAFNKDGDKIILSSSNSPKSDTNYIELSTMVEKYKDWMNQSGTMQTSFTAGRFKYSYYQMIEGYPLIIFVGFNRLEFWGNVALLTAQMTIVLMLLSVLWQEKKGKK